MVYLVPTTSHCSYSTSSNETPPPPEDKDNNDIEKSMGILPPLLSKNNIFKTEQKLHPDNVAGSSKLPTYIRYSTPVVSLKTAAPPSKSVPTWVIIVILGAILLFVMFNNQIQAHRLKKKLLEIDSLLFLDKLEDVIERSEEIIKNNPSSATAYYYKGIAHFLKNNFVASVKDFEKVIELDNVNEAQRAAALSYSSLGFLALGLYDEALLVVTESLKLNPHSGSALRAQGEIFEALNQNEKALESYKKALSKDSTNVDILHRIARVQEELSDYENSIATLSEVLTLNPYDKTAHWRKAKSLLYLGKLDDALVEVNKGLSLHPDSALCYYVKGLILDQIKGKEEESKICIERASYLMPGTIFHT